MDLCKENVFRARIAEEAERFEDMASAIKAVVECGQKLSEEERTLFSVAFKNNSFRQMMHRPFMGLAPKIASSDEFSSEA